MFFAHEEVCKASLYTKTSHESKLPRSLRVFAQRFVCLMTVLLAISVPLFLSACSSDEKPQVEAAVNARFDEFDKWIQGKLDETRSAAYDKNYMEKFGSTADNLNAVGIDGIRFIRTVMSSIKMTQDKPETIELKGNEAYVHMKLEMPDPNSFLNDVMKEFSEQVPPNTIPQIVKEGRSSELNDLMNGILEKHVQSAEKTKVYNETLRVVKNNGSWAVEDEDFWKL